MDTEYDVIVVGAGPVGLSLALGVARAGYRVIVLERNAATAEHSRAPAIWPRTQEVLDSLDVMDAFAERGTVRERLALHDVDKGRDALVLPLTELAGETPRPSLLILPQSQTERLLAEALQRHEHAEIRFNSEAVSVIQTDEGVQVTCRDAVGTERTLSASFVAGCDGAHSTVREAIGATLEGVTYDLVVALADVKLDGVDDLPFPRFSTRGGVVLAVRMGGGLWRLILPFAAAEDSALDTRVHDAVSRLFPAQQDGSDRPFDSVWQSEFRLHCRMSTRWVDGRIALAGDAAHLNSPVGGQGMNAGIQDAEALTRALCDALKDGTPAPLEDYARRRRGAAREVNRFTDRLTRGLLFSRGRFIRPALRVASLLLRIPALRRRSLRRVAMLHGD